MGGSYEEKVNQPKKTLEIPMSREHDAFKTAQIGGPGELLLYKSSANSCKRGWQITCLYAGGVSLESIDDGHVDW